MKLSDIIESIILETLATQSGVAQIRRNQLAAQVGCAPSQINYVINTRFNGQAGFLVESQRGGGGGILIRRINFSTEELLPHMLHHIPPELSQQEILICLTQLQNSRAISARELSLIKAATADCFLPETQPQKNRQRACIFQNMLAALCATPPSEKE